MVWWPRALTYGNWGGPGWSGGRFEADRAQVAWEVEPVDGMDAAFRLHDYSYQHQGDRAQADLDLVRSLAGTDVKGIWPNIYRAGAMAIFGLKGAIGRLLLAVLFASALAGCTVDPRADLFQASAPEHYQMIPSAVEMPVPDMEAFDPITPGTGTLPAEMLL